MEKTIYKVNSIVVEFDLDAILETPVIGSKREDIKKVEDCLLVEKHVQDWYTENYPDDELGRNLTDALSWYDLLDQMRRRRDIYNVIGVEDSLVRERVMGHLAQLLNVPYEVVCRLWLFDGDYTALGEYDEQGVCVRREQFENFKRPSFSYQNSLEHVLMKRMTLAECRDVKRLAEAKLHKAVKSAIAN